MRDYGRHLKFYEPSRVILFINGGMSNGVLCLYLSVSLFTVDTMTYMIPLDLETAVVDSCGQ